MILSHFSSFAFTSKHLPSVLCAHDGVRIASRALKKFCVHDVSCIAQQIVYELGSLLAFLLGTFVFSQDSTIQEKCVIQQYQCILSKSSLKYGLRWCLLMANPTVVAFFGNSASAGSNNLFSREITEFHSWCMQCDRPSLVVFIETRICVVKSGVLSPIQRKPKRSKTLVRE